MDETGKAYNVEIDDDGCRHCTAGRTWIVVGPDGLGGGTTYGQQEDAEEIAELMNMAYEAGARRGEKGGVGG